MRRLSHQVLGACLISFCIAACGGGGGAAGTSLTPLSDGAGQPAGSTSTPSAPISPSPSSPSSPATADATQARFNGPQGVALDGSGNLYVADTRNYTIRKITSSGTVTTLAGSAGAPGSADGTGPAARFTEPRSLAVDSDGNVYVADGSVIRKIGPGGVVTTLAGVQGQFGDDDGSGNVARFHRPSGIAVDASGNLFVADGADPTLRIRKIAPTGAVSTFAGGNTGGSTELPHDDVGTLAAFVGPLALAFGSNGDLYVDDVAMGGITAPNFYDGSTFVRRITPTGVVTTVAGTFGFGSLPAGDALADIAHSRAIAVDRSGNIFVTDRFNNANRIQKITATGQLAALPLDASQFGDLSGLAIDAAGNLYASDETEDAIVKIGPDGTVTIYAGKRGEAGSRDSS